MVVMLLINSSKCTQNITWGSFQEIQYNPDLGFLVVQKLTY